MPARGPAPPQRSRFTGHFRILRSVWPQIRPRFWRLWSDDDSDCTIHPDPMTASRQSSFEVRVPASTANMGAGFDCLGLALEMYLSVRATVLAKPEGRALARSRGVRGTSELPSDPDQNLIFRAMRHTAEREGFILPRVRLAVQNEIPVAGRLRRPAGGAAPRPAPALAGL